MHHSQRDTSFTQAIQHGASKRQAAQSMCSANFSRVWHGKISKNDIIVDFWMKIPRDTCGRDGQSDTQSPVCGARQTRSEVGLKRISPISTLT
jgi:hypothetical protein